MIKIEKAESYRICSHCYSKNDVMNINIRYQCTNTGTQITLCKECCESMVNEIRRVDLNPKAAAVKDEDDTERRAPSAQPNLLEAYSKAVLTWLMDYQIRAAELKGRYSPYEVLSWVINDWRKEHG